MIPQQEEPVGTTFPSREIAPPAHRRWAGITKGEFSTLEKRFRDWVALIDKYEELFRQNVYESQDAWDADFREHRMHLCALMAEGEELALDFLMFIEKNLPAEEATAFQKIIDHKLAALRLVFFQWHGPLEAQSDLPQEVLDGIRDIESGKVFDMEEALTQPPPGA
jgi:hypothetical protein